MHDPWEPRRVGKWLAQRCSITLDDYATTDIKAADITALKTQLKATGRFGRWVVRMLERLELRRGPG